MLLSSCHHTTHYNSQLVSKTQKKGQARMPVLSSSFLMLFERFKIANTRSWLALLTDNSSVNGIYVLKLAHYVRNFKWSNNLILKASHAKPQTLSILIEVDITIKTVQGKVEHECGTILCRTPIECVTS